MSALDDLRSELGPRAAAAPSLLVAWKARLLGLGLGVGVIWGVSLSALSFAHGLDHALALLPRDVGGLVGILGMVLVHGSLGHLISNTVPLVVLGAMVVARGLGYLATVALAVALLGGALLWCFGRSAAHIGASGLVFGLFGFVVARGLYERRLRSMIVALVAFFLYGFPMLFGLLPTDERVSWEAHLFGMVAGILVARGGLVLERRRQGAGEVAGEIRQF